MILERPEEPGKKYALAFTIAVHGLLVLVLFLGVQWKRSPPEVYEVELWSARPVVAVQPAPAPPPVSEPEPPKPEPKPQPKPEPKPEPKPQPKVEAPKQPDIAIKDDKKKPEPKKPEPPKPEPPKPEPKKPEPKPEPPKPEPKKPEPPKPEAKPQPKLDHLAKMLADESAEVSKAKSNAATKQQLANAAAAEAEQRASANKRGQGEYVNKIRAKVRGNIILPQNIQGNPEAVFIVEQLPSGDVLDVRLKRSSGNPRLDAAIEGAIRKSSPLPKPDNPALFERTLEIKYKPFEE
ncbi:MAG: TonB C-terminal domain-containing protein [Rhodocyclales bacterium]|nr:TonB C-terminal domain-containing protein [Rhodocyclales bacterium]